MRDIRTDEELAAVLDELSHRLKPIQTPLGLAFRARLRDFIAEQKLDGDPHSFASLPVGGPADPLLVSSADEHPATPDE